MPNRRESHTGLDFILPITKGTLLLCTVRYPRDPGSRFPRMVFLEPKKIIYVAELIGHPNHHTLGRANWMPTT